MSNARKVLVRGLYGWGVADLMHDAFATAKRNGSPANVKAGVACYEAFDVPEGTECGPSGALSYPLDKGDKPRRVAFLDKLGKPVAPPAGLTE